MFLKQVFWKKLADSKKSWKIYISFWIIFTPYREIFWHFCKQSRPRSRAAWSGLTLFAYGKFACGNMIHLILHWWTWQVISLFYVPTWKFIYTIIHSRWSLARIFMKERFKGCGVQWLNWYSIRLGIEGLLRFELHCWQTAMLCPWARHFIRCVVQVQPRKTSPNMTGKLLTET